MALDVALYNSTITISLSDDTNLGIDWGGALGMPNAQRIYGEAWGRGYSPLAAIDYRERTIELSIQVKASSHDVWISTFRQIEAMLLDVRTYYTTNGTQGDRAVLSVQLNGQTYPLEFDVLDGECSADDIFVPTMQSTTAPRITSVPLTLRVKPFGRTQQLSKSVSGTIVNGGGVTATNPGYSIGTPNGDVLTPARVTLQATTTWHRAMIGKKTQVTTAQFPFAVNMETGTGVGYTVTPSSGTNLSSTHAAVAGAHNGAVGRMEWSSSISTAVQPWRTVELTGDFEVWRGDYRVYARIDVLTGKVDYYQFSYGGSSGDAIVLPGSTNTTAVLNNFLVDLGVITLPPRFGPLDTPMSSVKMRLSGSILKDQGGGATTTGHIDLDCLYFMPINEGFTDVLLSNSATALSQLVVDKLQPYPQAYLLDSSGNLTSAQQSVRPFTNTFFDVTPNVNNIFYALVTTTSGSMDHNLADTYTLTVEHYPQYVLGRTSAS